MDRIRARHDAKMAKMSARRASRQCNDGCGSCGQSTVDCGCGGGQYAPAENYSVPVEQDMAPLENYAPGEVAPDQGVNQNPIVDPSAFIINNNNYSHTN